VPSSEDSIGFGISRGSDGSIVVVCWVDDAACAVGVSAHTSDVAIVAVSMER
jgi:hypothetical protein